MSKNKRKSSYKKNKKLASLKPKPFQGKDMQIVLEKALGEIVALYQQGKVESALLLTEKTLVDFPEQPVLLGNAGAFSMLLGDQQMALEYYQKSLLLDSSNPDVHNNIGNLFKQQSRYVEAENAYLKALELRDDFSDAYNNLGNIYREQGRDGEVEAAFRKAIQLQPENAEAYCNLGSFLNEYSRFEEAESAFQNALKLRPDYAETHNNYGNLLRKQQRYVEAELAFKNAIVLRPSFEKAYFNQGKLAIIQNEYSKAKSCFNEALKINPDYVDARANLALVLLRLGDFVGGWEAYEARYRLDTMDAQSIPPEIQVPQWAGECLKGKTLLVWPEQGLGDDIQFVRYLSLLKAEGVQQLILVCRKPLERLFSSVDCIDRLIVEEDFLTEGFDGLDYWVFMMSLPLFFKTRLETIPATLPYLSVPETDQNKWAEYLPQSGFRVGCVWKGRAEHKNDMNRSLSSLEVLKPLWEVNGIEFISLQKGEGEEEALFPLDNQPIISLGDKVQCFVDTAAIIVQLDLVICVDTAIAHLAGALNKPCWVLLPEQDSDWRWLLDRDDSPWYPKVMRLFRQKSKGDWDGVVQEVLQALKTEKN